MKAPRLRGNFVLLRADTLRLLLPQHEVGAAEYIEGAPGPGSAGGLFEYGDGDGPWPWSRCPAAWSRWRRSRRGASS